MAVTDDAVMLGIFTALESAHAYSAFLPSMFTIRTFGGDEDCLRDIRQGEALATGFALLLGLVVSRLTKSGFPFLAAIVVSAAMVGIYEYALHTPHEDAS